MLKQLLAIFFIFLLILNIFAFATVKISMIIFWINLLILLGISHLFVKFSKEDKKKRRRKNY